MTSLTGLPAIITAARAGALDRAEDLFRAGGYDGRTGDPAALAVKGRLLKDRAALLPAPRQPHGFAQAAAAYAAADALVQQPYTRINVATLTLLAGDRDKARAIAEEIIPWLDADPSIRETPYFLAATQAEAWLICGNVRAARERLAAGIARAPLAFEDHATTLRQMDLLARHLGLGTAWLEEFRPPRSLHYAGHMDIGENPDPRLIAEIDTVLEAERIGFAFGALAAGSDLTIAERVIAHGGELHVVLPIREAAFIEQSVRPFGDGWIRRFAACRDAAQSWTETACDTGSYEPLASRLAADVAMGAAVGHSRRIASDAVQMIIADDGPGPYGDGAYTARDAMRWQDTGRATHILHAPRRHRVRASGLLDEPEGCPDRRLAAMLQIDFHGLAQLDEAGFAQVVETMLRPLRVALAGIAVQPAVILPCGNSRIVAFETPGSAFAFARRLLAIPCGRFPVKIAGHYGLAHWLSQPDALVGRSIGQLGTIAAAVIPGTLTVSENFASALSLDAADEFYAEPVGEIDDLKLMAIRFAIGEPQ